MAFLTSLHLYIPVVMILHHYQQQQLTLRERTSLRTWEGGSTTSNFNTQAITCWVVVHGMETTQHQMWITLLILIRVQQIASRLSMEESLIKQMLDLCIIQTQHLQHHLQHHPQLLLLLPYLQRKGLQWLLLKPLQHLLQQQRRVRFAREDYPI